MVTLAFCIITRPSHMKTCRTKRSSRRHRVAMTSLTFDDCRYMDKSTTNRTCVAASNISRWYKSAIRSGRRVGEARADVGPTALTFCVRNSARTNNSNFCLSPHPLSHTAHTNNAYYPKSYLTCIPLAAIDPHATNDSSISKLTDLTPLLSLTTTSQRDQTLRRAIECALRAASNIPPAARAATTKRYHLAVALDTYRMKLAKTLQRAIEALR